MCYAYAQTQSWSLRWLINHGCFQECETRPPGRVLQVLALGDYIRTQKEQEKTASCQKFGQLRYMTGVERALAAVAGTFITRPDAHYQSFRSVAGELLSAINLNHDRIKTRSVPVRCSGFWHRERMCCKTRAGGYYFPLGFVVWFPFTVSKGRAKATIRTNTEKHTQSKTPLFTAVYWLGRW